MNIRSRDKEENFRYLFTLKSFYHVAKTQGDTKMADAIEVLIKNEEKIMRQPEKKKIQQS